MQRQNSVHSNAEQFTLLQLRVATPLFLYPLFHSVNQPIDLLSRVARMQTHPDAFLATRHRGRHDRPYDQPPLLTIPGELSRPGRAHREYRRSIVVVHPQDCRADASMQPALAARSQILDIGPQARAKLTDDSISSKPNPCVYLPYRFCVPFLHQLVRGPDRDEGWIRHGRGVDQRAGVVDEVFACQRGAQDDGCMGTGLVCPVRS